MEAIPYSVPVVLMYTLVPLIRAALPTGNKGSIAAQVSDRMMSNLWLVLSFSQDIEDMILKIHNI